MKFVRSKTNIFHQFEELCIVLLKTGDELSRVPASFPNDIEERARILRALENEADDITHRIIDEVNKTFITPLDREDLYMLAHRIDDVIDFIENAVSNFVVYGITAPRAYLEEFCILTHKATKEVAESVRGLNDLKNSCHIFTHTLEINNLESQADEIFKKALSDLFHNEPDTKEIMKWKDIFQSFERALDRAEDVSNVIEGIVLKNT